MRFRDSALLLVICLVFTFSIAVAETQAKDRPRSHSKTALKSKSHAKHVDKKKRKRVKSSKSSRHKKGVQAKAVYCVNLRSNETLLARNPDQQLPVASLTKLVTAMVTLDKFKPDQKVSVPDHIKSIPKSVVGLKAGDKVSIEDLLHGLLIGSGNDCAETLACSYPGGRTRFISAMNQKVRAMGMKRTKFYTPSGLDHKTWTDDDTCDVDSNVSTAREIAGIAKEAFENPTIRRISQKKHFTMASSIDKDGYQVRTTNKLLRDKLPLVGGKTGFTSRAGHCLATEFRPGKNVFVIVVLGSPDHFGDTRLVYNKALKETTKIRYKSGGSSKRMAAN